MDANVLQLADDGRDSDGTVGLQRETVPGVMKCPYCQTELTLLWDDAPLLPDAWVTCVGCHNRLNSCAQLAYARAHEAYLSVHDLLAAMPPAPLPGTVHRAKTRLNLDTLPPDVIFGYQQAYSGLTIAFQYDLPDVQKVSGIEMMAEIARAFAPRAMMSPLEAEYWTKLMMEVTVRRELQNIEDRLTRPSYSIAPGFLLHWRWRVRRHQLKRAVDKIRAKITEIERTIGFLNPPHVR